MLGNSVKISVQNDLADEGKHNMVDGICLGLDGEYPNWKTPTQTYMVSDSFPSRKGDKGSSAEYIIYSLLQECGANLKEPMFVVHSCPFSEHIPESERKRSWVMGETDFVIIHKIHGPIYIEVKATDTGKSFKEAEEQLQKGKLALMRRFENAVKGEIPTRQVIEIFKNFPAFWQGRIVHVQIHVVLVLMFFIRKIVLAWLILLNGETTKSLLQGIEL